MRHLTQEERYHIYSEKKAGRSVSEIAGTLGRSRSTIYAELARNTGQRGYRPSQAHSMAQERWQEAHSGCNRKIVGELLTRLEAMIRQDWSPEQISGVLQGEGISIHHETLYRYIYQDKAAGGDLYRHLRRANRVYKKRYGRYDKRGKIQGRVGIEERPASVEDRSEVGHWEGDTVKDTPNNRSIVTLVERSTRCTLLASVPSLHSEVVSAAIIGLLEPLKDLVASLTFDNGKEFSGHLAIGKALSAHVYFADPYHSWQRGTNENTNGLLRQYVPKRKTKHEPEDLTLEEIQERLNTRPRKCLNYRSPSEVFAAETGTTINWH